MTETVERFEAYGPDRFLLPHPSWRSAGWMRRNPWFETEVLPALRLSVRSALARETGVGRRSLGGGDDETSSHRRMVAAEINASAIRRDDEHLALPARDVLGRPGAVDRGRRMRDEVSVGEDNDIAGRGL